MAGRVGCHGQSDLVPFPERRIPRRGSASRKRATRPAYVGFQDGDLVTVFGLSTTSTTSVCYYRGNPSSLQDDVFAARPEPARFCVQKDPRLSIPTPRRARFTRRARPIPRTQTRPRGRYPSLAYRASRGRGTDRQPTSGQRRWRRRRQTNGGRCLHSVGKRATPSSLG